MVKSFKCTIIKICVDLCLSVVEKAEPQMDTN